MAKNTISCHWPYGVSSVCDLIDPNEIVAHLGMELRLELIWGYCSITGPFSSKRQKGAKLVFLLFVSGESIAYIFNEGFFLWFYEILHKI
jgi:hypothetical protein